MMDRFPYGKRSLEGNLVPLNALNSLVGDNSLAILQSRSNINGLPFNWRLKGNVSHIPYFHRERNGANRTLAALKMSFTDWAISGPIPSPSIRLTV